MAEQRPRPFTESDIEGVEPETVRLQIAPSQVMSIRLSATELKRIANAARASQMTVGAFVKAAALRAADTGELGPARVQFAYSSGLTLYGPAGLHAAPSNANAAFECTVRSMNPSAQQLHLIGG